MKKIPVKLRITGTRSASADDSVNDFFVEGSLRHTKTGFVLEYPEPAETPSDGVMTTLRYSGDLLTLERDGENGLIIERERRHICRQLTPFGSIYIGVNGGEITVSDNGRRLDMEISYSVDINTSLASRNNIKIVAERLAPPQ